jgi:hypothetical protein
MNAWNNGVIFNPLELGCSNSDWITEYANKATWDPVGLTFRFQGAAHGNCYAGKFVAYSEASNSWTALPYFPGECQSIQGCNYTPFSHAYDHNTVDPATGDFYYHPYGTADFYVFSAGTWTKLASATGPGTHVCCSAIEWFPEMDGFLWWDAQAGLWAWSKKTGRWTGLANACISDNVGGLKNLATNCQLGYFAEYSQTAHAVLIGDSSDEIFRVDGSGTVTALGKPPIPTGVAEGGGGAGAQVTVDPVTGYHIFIDDSSMYQYDLQSDSWSLLSVPTRPAFFDTGGVMESLIGTPVSTYGVIMYVKADDSSMARAFLYKHAPSTIVAPDAGSPADGGSPPPSNDAGPVSRPEAGGPDGSGLPESPEAQGSAGCSCRVDRSAPTADSWAIAAALGLGWLRAAGSTWRRRRCREARRSSTR